MEYGNLTIESALDDFLRHCRYERKLDEKTISAYRVDLKQFASSFGLNYNGPLKLDTELRQIKNT